MRSFPRMTLAGLSAMAALAMAGAGISAAQASNKTTASASSEARAELAKQQREEQRNGRAMQAIFRNAGGYGGGLYRKAGPGWSHAQVQRMARKKKNQAKHKRASRR